MNFKQWLENSNSTYLRNYGPNVQINGRVNPKGGAMTPEQVIALANQEYGGIRMVIDVNSGKVAIGPAQIHADLIGNSGLDFIPRPIQDWIAAWWRPQDKVIGIDKIHLTARRLDAKLIKPALNNLVAAGLVTDDWKVRGFYGGIQPIPTIGELRQGQPADNEELEKADAANNQRRELDAKMHYQQSRLQSLAANRDKAGGLGQWLGRYGEHKIE